MLEWNGMDRDEVLYGDLVYTAMQAYTWFFFQSKDIVQMETSKMLFDSKVIVQKETLNIH